MWQFPLIQKRYLSQNNIVWLILRQGWTFILYTLLTTPVTCWPKIAKKVAILEKKKLSCNSNLLVNSRIWQNVYTIEKVEQIIENFPKLQ